MADEVRLYPRDAMSVGYCVQGQKRLAEAHGFDWKSYVRNGVPVSELEHIDDTHLQRAIDAAKARASEEAP